MKYESTKDLIQYYWERLYPYVYSLLITYFFYHNSYLLHNYYHLLKILPSNSLTISSTLLGFFLTILTIISSINTRRIRFLRDSGIGYQSLMKYLHHAIVMNMINIACSILILVLNINSISTFNILLLIYLYFFILTCAMLTSMRFAIIFIKLLADPK